MVEFMSAAELFKCPNCNSQYKLVRVEADPAATYGQIECPHCGGPLNGREGRFILKYFLIDRRGGNSSQRVSNRSLCGVGLPVYFTGMPVWRRSVAGSLP
jgi:DNA-directed RNA polymerase subunit RPC12/RpoP